MFRSQGSLSRQWLCIFPEATRREKRKPREGKNTQMCGMEASPFLSFFIFFFFSFYHLSVLFTTSSSHFFFFFPFLNLFSFLLLLFLLPSLYHPLSLSPLPPLPLIPHPYKNTKSGFQHSVRVHKVHDDVHLSLLKLGDPSYYRLFLLVCVHLSHC